VSRTRGIHIRGGIKIDGRETRPLSGSKRSTWIRRYGVMYITQNLWQHYIFATSSVFHNPKSLLPRCNGEK
jgi:hypothetical protein